MTSYSRINQNNTPSGRNGTVWGVVLQYSILLNMIFRFIPPNAVKAAVLARFFHAGGEIRHKGLRIVHRHIIPTQIRRNLYQAVPVHTHNRYESVAPAAASRSTTSARSRLCRR